ncbi:MAG: O-antigen ligase family protein [Candidatus Muiribacteriota bacterium]
MTLTLKQFNYDKYKKIITKTAEILLILLFFFQPLGVAPANIITTLILLFFLVSGEYKAKFREIKNNKVAVALLLFFSLFVLGFLWSSNIQEAFYILRKQRRFLLIPCMLFYYKKEKFIKYINAYLLSVLVMLFFSFLLYFNFSPPDYFVTNSSRFTPFHHHVNHGIFISIGFFIVGFRIIKNLKSKMLFFYVPLAFLMGFNILITRGRTGHLALFFAVFFLLLKLFKINSIKRVFLCLIFTIILIVSFFKFLPAEYTRVNEMLRDFKRISEAQSSRDYAHIVTGRGSFWLACIELWKDNKILGTGQGDFKEEFIKKHKDMFNSKPRWPNNPHSFYLLTLARHGILGVVILLFVFYQMYIFAFKDKNNEFFLFRLFFITTFLFINFFDIYFENHAVFNLFAMWTPLLFKRE